MAGHRMPPTDLLDQLAAAGVDALRVILQHTLQRLIEAEASAYIGAEPGERSPMRTTYRNGHRSRVLDTRVGRLGLQIPKMRTGSFFPSLLEPRRRIERCCWP
jgi:putative transposase